MRGDLGRAGVGSATTPGGPAASARDWPTVGEILAAQGVRPTAASGSKQSAARKKKPARRPMPTVARAPGEWSLSLWLAWLPAVLAALAVGAAGVALSGLWAYDAFLTGMVAARLADSDARKVMKPLPEGVGPPAGSWWRSNAPGLIAWAAYLDRRSDDPADVEEARALLDRAGVIAPLDATVHYAQAHKAPAAGGSPAEVLVRSLGQSHDVVTLTWTGRQLRAAGKKDAALRAYRAALQMASRPDFERAVVPSYLDEMQIRRYALPAEDVLTTVIRDLAEAREWTFKDWSGLLPRGTPAAVSSAK